MPGELLLSGLFILLGIACALAFVAGVKAGNV